jgi:hypothetical protein
MPHRAVNADMGTFSERQRLSSVVTEAWPHKPYTFRALRKTFGAMWLRCDLCRRYAPLSIGGLQDVDYRSKTFSCSQCGSEAYPAVIEPIKEAGMQDYRLDAIERPERHPTATDRLTGRGPGAPVDYSGGELPGRKVDGRR